MSTEFRGASNATARRELGWRPAWTSWRQGSSQRPAMSHATPLLGPLAASISQFANKHGVYLGRRSTKIHVALYRCSGGRMGGHLPGWPQARILLLEHIGA